ncbi:MAG TPA: hypothetical protein VGR53_09660, partial [Nitrososphaerales archaeon]|nr:hypothetical protein [Nitrososphaerales archaeon]
MIASSENDLGVVDSGTVLDEVLFEMLEHQGVLYEKVNEKERKTYPVVLIATGDADAVVKGRKNCSSSEGVVVVDRSIDLKHVLRCLAGLEVQKEDRFKFVVNEFEVKLMAMVKDALSATNSPLTRKGFWPGNAPACCVMTSDVDWLTYSPFHKAVAKGRLSPRRLARLIYGSLSGKNYGLNFDSMVKAQKKHNYKSTVFLRSSYEKGGENLAGGVGLLKEAGFEIALHGSDGAHSSLDTLSSQMEDIASIAGARPKGVRQHILKMDIPKTWEIES